MANTKDWILIGLPGCGKTTLGRLLAEAANRPFLDLDAEIERLAGKAIPQIFSQEGEAVFRQWETLALKQVIGKGRVIATGGGVVTKIENRPIAKTGVVIWIDRPVADIMGDVKTETRPLLASGKERLLKLKEERYERYADWADLRIMNQGPMGDVIERILNEVNQYETNGN